MRQLSALLVLAAILGATLAEAQAPRRGEKKPPGRTVLVKECVPPGELPKIPDGRTATPAEMLEARNQVTGFVERTDLFLACMVEWEKPDEESTAKYRTDVRARYSAAQKRSLEVTERFNEQVRIFKTRIVE